MSRSKSYAGSCRLIKEKARELMLAGENHLNILLGLIAVSTAAVAPIMICSLLYDQLGDVLYLLVLIAMEFLLVSPMAISLIGMTRAMAKGDRVSFAEVFSAYASIKKYLTSIALSIVSILLALGVILGVLMASVFVLRIIDGDPNVVMTSVTALICLVVGAVSLFFIFRLAALVALVCDGYGLWKSAGLSFSITKNKSLRILGLAVGFLPLIIISVLAICVPLYVYTLPYLLCVYSVGVDNLMKNNE